MKILLKEVGKAPQVTEIDNSLETLQGIVEGYIEVITLTPDILLIVNEEGALKGLSANFQLGNMFIVGNAFFVSQKGQDFASLKNEHIDLIMNRLFKSEEEN